MRAQQYRRINEAGQQGYARRGTNSSSKSLANKIKGAALMEATEECSKNIHRVFNLMAALLEKKMSPPSAVMTTPVAMSSTPPAEINSKKRSLCECLDDVRRLRVHEQEIKDDTGVSPMTKEMILSKIHQEKKMVIMRAAGSD